MRGREVLCLFEEETRSVCACDSVEILVGAGGSNFLSTLFSTKKCRAVIRILMWICFFVVKIQVVGATQVEGRLPLYVPPFL